MLSIITAILSIARNTFTESVRQPIYLVLTMATISVMVMSMGWSGYSMDNDQRMLIDTGLGTLMIAGMLIAAFSASSVLSREIENKTVLTVISKPIGRPAFIIGKYLGVTAAVTMAFWIAALVFLMLVRHKVMSAASDQYDRPVILFGSSALLIALIIAAVGNYLYNWIFTSTFTRILAVTLPIAFALVLMFNKQWELQSITTEFVNPKSTNYSDEPLSMGYVIMAVILLLQVVWIMCAVAIACSTRLGQVMTLLICIAVFLLGGFSDAMFGQQLEHSVFARIAYAITPNMQIGFVADALNMNHPIHFSYVAMVLGYGMIYVVAILGLSIALFQNRQTS